MTWRERVGAHLSDPDTVYEQRKPLHGDFGTVTFAPRAAPIVTIRPAGEHGSELYVRTGDGAFGNIVVPLSYGHLLNLIEDAAAGLRRTEET